MDQDKKCSHCGGGTAGYKCNMCGEELAEHDASHGCGGDHCMSKCAACNQAQAECSC